MSSCFAGDMLAVIREGGSTSWPRGEVARWRTASFLRHPDGSPCRVLGPTAAITNLRFSWIGNTVVRHFTCRWTHNFVNISTVNLHVGVYRSWIHHVRTIGSNAHLNFMFNHFQSAIYQVHRNVFSKRFAYSALPIVGERCVMARHPFGYANLVPTIDSRRLTIADRRSTRGGLREERVEVVVICRSPPARRKERIEK